MSERLSYLFNRHVAGTASADEVKELMGLVILPGMQEELYRLAEAAWTVTGETHDVKEERADEIFRSVFATPVISIETAKRKGRWTRWMAAASVIILIGIVSYFLFFDKKHDNPPVVADTDVAAPKNNRAMITLAGGDTIYLDAASNGTLRTQSGVVLSKLSDGQVQYKRTSGNASASPSIVYNTLTNPRGSRVIDMLLADGSRVWLNAGSSVTYPVAFAGKERRISITGEAYFEIAHDKAKPFYVTKDDMQVQVLGTHFNVNAYDDEENIKVTLLEGSVSVSGESRMTSRKATVLEPGQQAVIRHLSFAIAVNSNVNLEEVMAWKDGKFIFGRRTGIAVIMRQVARWYDVDIVYEGSVTTEFGGSLSRHVNVSQVLRVLEQTGGVHFEIRGRTIYVRP